MNDRSIPYAKDPGGARAGLAVALVAASALGWMSAAVSRGGLAGPDHALLAFFAAAQGPMPDAFFQAVTWLGSAYLLVPATLLLVAWFGWRRQWRAAWLMAITYFGATLTAWALKVVIGRERPVLHPALADFIRMDWSFPSGHTTHAAAFALGLWLLLGDRRPVAGRPAVAALGGVVLLVAVSRLHLQVHWPSDVLAGLLVALFWAGLAAAAVGSGRFPGRLT